ncbi:hypothetical protein MPSEU_000764900 [Mayamaea pseudoterrestris]|nr:hypothetical protein MPSEU_000764900 [Mayamaea pseudoterrestris]
MMIKLATLLICLASPVLAVQIDSNKDDHQQQQGLMMSKPTGMRKFDAIRRSFNRFFEKNLIATIEEAQVSIMANAKIKGSTASNKAPSRQEETKQADPIILPKKDPMTSMTDGKETAEELYEKNFHSVVETAASQYGEKQVMNSLGQPTDGDSSDKEEPTAKRAPYSTPVEDSKTKERSLLEPALDIPTHAPSLVQNEFRRPINDFVSVPPSNSPTTLPTPGEPMHPSLRPNNTVLSPQAASSSTTTADPFGRSSPFKAVGPTFAPTSDNPRNNVRSRAPAPLHASKKGSKGLFAPARRPVPLLEETQEPTSAPASDLRPHSDFLSPLPSQAPSLASRKGSKGLFAPVRRPSPLLWESEEPTSAPASDLRPHSDIYSPQPSIAPSMASAKGSKGLLAPMRRPSPLLWESEEPTSAPTNDLRPHSDMHLPPLQAPPLASAKTSKRVRAPFRRPSPLLWESQEPTSAPTNDLRPHSDMLAPPSQAPSAASTGVTDRNEADPSVPSPFGPVGPNVPLPSQGKSPAHQYQPSRSTTADPTSMSQAFSSAQTDERKQNAPIHYPTLDPSAPLPASEDIAKPSTLLTGMPPTPTSKEVPRPESAKPKKDAARVEF